MKRLILTVLLSLSLMVAPVSARRHHNPPPPPPPVSGHGIYGVNYGHNFAGNTYDPNLATADLNELKVAGVQAIRIYMGTSGNYEVNFTEQLATLAKSKGFIVTWGICTGGSVSTTPGWNAYLASVNAYAAWANSNGVDYFSLGNEEEFVPLPTTTIENGIRSKAAELKTLYPNLKLTYAAAAFPNLVTAWLNNTGSLDQVGMNVYVDFQNITNQLRTNPKMVISEWNTDNGINYVNGSESRWATELVNDRNIINTSGVKAYLFVIRGNGGGINDDWSMWIGNTRRQAWGSLIQ